MTIPYPLNPPYPFYYSFIATRFGFLHNDDDLGEYALEKGLPYEEEYAKERYIRRFKEDENGLDDYEMVGFNELGAEWLEKYKEENGNYPIPDGASIEYPLIDISFESLDYDG